MPQKEIKEKIIEDWEKELDEQWKETDHYIIWGWWVKDMIKKLLKSEKEKLTKEFTSGERCLSCGAEKESNLTNLCDKCLEEE